MDAGGANAEQIRYWNEVAGPKWVALGERIDAVIAPLGRRVLERAAARPGERVLDVGCGTGGTTLELARRVGPSGTVLGVDVSAPLIDRARARAASQPDVPARFQLADAQTEAFPAASTDLVFSRFGVMFFADPRAAFTNLGRALRPGGRVVFVCWRPLAENPWMLVPLGAVAAHVPLPPPPAPDQPGPFAFGAADRVRGILTHAGFGSVTIDPVDEPLTLGERLDATAEFLLQMGPAAAVLREADPAVLPRVAAAVREALAPHATSDAIRLPSAAWLVSAVRT